MSDFTHLIITRFNLKTGFTHKMGFPKGSPPDERWLVHRFALFDQFCFPSVHHQTNQDFKWLVFFDHGTPETFRKRITEYQKWVCFIPYFIASNQKDFYKTEFDQIIHDHIRPGSRYLITTRLDNDDAIHTTFIETLQRCFAYQTFRYINFPSGYIYASKTKKLYKLKHYTNPFISLIEQLIPLPKEEREDKIVLAPESPRVVPSGFRFRTVARTEHNRLLDNPALEQVETQPLWLQVIHEKNVANRLRFHKRVRMTQLSGNFFLAIALETGKEPLTFLPLENFLNSILRKVYKIYRSFKDPLKS